MDRDILKKKNGFTLIEMLIVVTVSGILLAGVYKTFISQQKTQMIQEQVSEMQQNIIGGIGQLTKELKMAGSGGNIFSVFDNVNGFTNIITPASNSITFVVADKVGVLAENASKGEKKLSITNAVAVFNKDEKKYLCLNGLYNYEIKKVKDGEVELESELAEDHLLNESVYLIKAITYNLGVVDGKNALQRNENLGSGPQPLAENIESLQFIYYDADGNVTANPSAIRTIKVTGTIRTNMADPDYKGGDGYRRRTLSSNVYIRNMGS
jgi:type IV pilus assembly protein PilW